MILFYAQSENSEIVVTSPRLTFPGGVSAAGNVAEPYLYGVQPISYTLPDGTSYDFNGTDIKKFLYEPKNNGHNIIRVQFVDTFRGNSGCVVTLRASFLDGRFQTFTLPFAKSKVQTTSNASTEALTISINSKGYRSPITSATVFSNSTKENTITNNDASFISIDINNYPETKKGVLEVVGGIADTSVIDSKLFTDAIKNSKTKYLISKFFVDNAANASYFYIYAEECNKTIAAVKGCFEANADNTTTAGAAFIGISSNSCNYARRAPNNVVIEHIPGAKETLATVKYIEENLPQDTDPIDGTDDFDVHTVSTYINGSANSNSTPASETINVDGTNTLIVFEWDDVDSDSGFKRPLNAVQDKGQVRMSSNVGSSDDNRSYIFPFYVTGSAGCTDPNSLNYDSNATTDDGSCISCDKVINEITRGIGFEIFVDSGAVIVDNDDTTNLVVKSILAGSDLPLIQYLSTLATTIWTADIYKAEDVSLNEFGKQATISGTVVVNNSSLGGNTGTSTLPLFNKVPTASSGLNSGRSFTIQFTLTLGSCVHYFYKTFGVPFNGCSEPSATNYLPNPLNTGNGACDFDVSNRSNCDGSIQASISTGTFIGSSWNYNFIINGTFDENEILLAGETIYTVVKTFYVNGDYYYQANPSTFSFSGEPINLFQGAPQGYSIVYTITDSTTGCTTEVTWEDPLVNAVLGCTDSTAENYNPLATEEDGTCLFCNGEIEILSISNPTGSGSECSSYNSDGVITMASGINIPTAYQYYSRYRAGTPSWGPWIPLGTYGEGDNVFTNMAPGFYEIKVEYQVSSDYMCTVPLEGNDESVQVFNGVLYLSTDTSGCGCTDPEATNYDSTATSDDGSCLRFGCTDKLAINLNRAATVDDGSCVYSAEPDSPLCIPDQLDNNQTYSTFLEGLANCVVNEGTTLLLKTKGGIKCDTVEQVKLSLITYLLNRIGLECMYNCNYTFAHGDSGISCSGKWSTGGPSGQELVWVSGTSYVKGDIIQYTDAEGEVYYIEFLTNSTGTTSTPNTWSLDGLKLKRCENVTLPSGTETYLNTFINFARKFCTVCLIAPTSIGEVMQTTTNTLNDIQFENGDNINLNG
tara:strand:- start:179 stop:3466 length:3288 start_codon:yes stop_codon:yes gene_type:complete